METNTNNKKIYTYDDYREEINAIVSRNKKRIKITKILKECGISRGNYYTFKSGGKDYNGRKMSTLSYEKLDRLLNVLRSVDCYADYPTSSNRKKMESMSNRKMAEYLFDNLLSYAGLEKIYMLKWI